MTSQIEEVLSVEHRRPWGQAVAFGGRLRLSPDRALEVLRGPLAREGYTPFLRAEQGRAWVYALPLAQVMGRPNPLVNLGLFVATVFTTLLAGAWNFGGVSPGELFADPMRLMVGFPFSASLLSILVFHEFGHYTLGRRHGMPITLPYFIPVPPPFPVGTLGAVIRLRGPVRDRLSLFDMAVAGPLAGLVLAIPLCVLGLRLSSVVPMPPASASTVFLEFGESLLLKLLEWLVLGPLPSDHVVLLHPVGVAAWFGFFVTVLNLMPVGQLDGGHLVYALFGRRHALISKLTVGVLVVLGLSMGSYVWVFWALMVSLVMGFQHGPPMNDITPLDGRRRALGVFTLLLLFVLLPPVPIR